VIITNYIMKMAFLQFLWGLVLAESCGFDLG